MKKDDKEYIIEVQVCSNCHLHSWCSRHQQSKYNEFFQHFKSKAQSISTRIAVVKNHIPLGYKKIGGKSQIGQNRYFDLGSNQIVIFPRFGAFQIYFNKTLVFSKLKSGLWPHVDRIAQLIEMIIKSHDKGQDIDKYSLDYRIKHDQTQYFLQTYKAQIVRQLGSARKQSKSLQKIGESPHKNFKTRRMVTNSKYKANGQMTDSSPIINKNKFSLFENNNLRPLSRDKHLYTKQNENQQKLVESVQERQMQIHEWKISKKSPKNMLNYKNNSNEAALKSPYSKKHDKQYLHKESSPKIQGEKNPSLLPKKLDKLNGASPKIKLNTERIKNEEEIKKRMKQEEQKAKDENERVKQRKQESAVNGWSQNQTDSQLFQDNSKTKVEYENDGKSVQKLAKKPSIRENLQFPSHGTIIQSQNTKADNDLSNKKISQKGKQSNINTNSKMQMNRNQGTGSDILGSEKSGQQNYDNENYFEQAESEISWQADKIYMRYKQTINWTCKLTKNISPSGKHQQTFEITQDPFKTDQDPFKRGQDPFTTDQDPIQTSQILEHPKNTRKQQKEVQKPIQISWNAIYTNKQFILQQHGQQYQYEHKKQKSIMKDIQDQYSIVDDVELNDQVVRIQEDSDVGQSDDILMGVQDQHDDYHIQIKEVHDPSDLGSARNKNTQDGHSHIVYDIAGIGQFQQLDWQADHIQNSWNIQRVQKNKKVSHTNKNKSVQQGENNKSQVHQSKADEGEGNEAKVQKENGQKRKKQIEHYNWTGVYSKGQFQISQAVGESQQIAGP